MINFTNNQIEPLLELGLTKIQSLIYLTLLNNGIMSILEISKVVRINRQQIYQNSEILLSLGFIEMARKNKRKYIACNPNKLLRIGREKITNAESIFENIKSSLPLYESMVPEEKWGVTIKYYDGLNKVKEAYEEELDNCKEVEVLSLVGSVEDIYKFFPESYWKKWNKKFKDQKSSSRMLVHKSESAKESSFFDKEYNRETRYLEVFPLKINIDIFNDKLLLVSFYDKTAIWIESRVISDSYRIMFETLWSNSKNF
ncbi:MAG: helix-turn-helix domain-containing protein [Candidatus Paceibacterota bacterium]|jgi:sugar-specific transcriptional regulator TrmB